MGRFIGLELVLLLTLGLLAVSGNLSIDRADSGLDGGRIGWGIATLAWMLGPVLGTAASGFIVAVGCNEYFWFVESGGALVAAPFRRGSRLLNLPWNLCRSWMKCPSPVEEKSKPKKKPAPLPPEFRKSLRAPETQDSRPAEPPPRKDNFPPLTILSGEQVSRPDERTINQTAGMVEKTLSEFGIPATVIGFRVGPTVTQFAVQPGFIKKNGSEEEDARLMKVRVAQIAALQKDLALALSAQRLRIQAPVPGKTVCGYRSAEFQFGGGAIASDPGDRRFLQG